MKTHGIIRIFRGSENSAPSLPSFRQTFWVLAVFVGFIGFGHSANANGLTNNTFCTNYIFATTPCSDFHILMGPGDTLDLSQGSWTGCGAIYVGHYYVYACGDVPV